MVADKTKNRYAASVMLFMFICAICASTQGVLLTDFINYYGLQSSSQGMMSAFQSAGNILSLILIVVYVSKLKKSVVLMVSAIMITAIFFVLGTKPSYATLLLCYCLYGIFFSFFDSLASSVMADLFKEKSSQYMNMLHGSYGIGAMTGPLLFQFLNNGRHFVWYQILLTLGFVSLAGAVLYAVGAAPMIRRKGVTVEQRTSIRFSDLTAFFKTNKKRILFICASLYGAHQIGMSVWTTRYISEYLHAPQWGPVALSVFWGGIAVSRIIITRFNLQPVKVICVGNFLAGAVLCAGVLSGNSFFMMICCCAAGFMEGGVLPFSIYLGCAWEPENTALGSTMIFFAHYAGFVITPPAIGFLIASSGATVGMFVPVIAALTAGCFAVYLWREEVRKVDV